jgi:hypothetical protein
MISTAARAGFNLASAIGASFDMEFAKRDFGRAWRGCGAALVAAAGLAFVFPPPAAFAAQPDRATAQNLAAFGQAPLYFEANRGQVEGPTRFIARGRVGNVLLTPTEATLLLVRRNNAGREPRLDRAADPRGETLKTRSVRARFPGANEQACIAGRDELPGKANYFLGNDPAKWRAGVPLFSKVQVQGLYEGVDLVYYCTQQQLEYDFALAPGADPNIIAIRYDGADKLEVDGRGDLVLKVGADEIRQHRPVIYQMVNGARKDIAGGYELRGKATVGFQLGDYDRRLPLIIDPLLSFSTYLGGSGGDIGWDVALDDSGNIYVAGETLSANFPATAGAFQAGFNGGTVLGGDAFVAKFTNSGPSLVYLTYLGGSGNDAAFALAVDGPGNAFITGFTDSTNFPLAAPIQGAINGTPDHTLKQFPLDAFVAQLDPTGSNLLYSTYLGGDGVDEGTGVALDNSGNLYVTGFTDSTNFPVSNVPQNVFGGRVDAFVTKIIFTNGQMNFGYSRYLGGTNVEHGDGVAVDAMGCAYVTGFTASTNFPTANALVINGVQYNRLNAGDTNLTSFSDAFVTKLAADGNALVYSTFLGGSGIDVGLRITVDSALRAYVTGYSRSLDFPVTVTNLQRSLSASNFLSDVFVAKFDASGTNVVYSTLFGGEASDQGIDVAVDDDGNAYVAGVTASTNFPVQSPGALNTNNAGANDVFIAALNADASAFLYSGYLGGSGNEIAYGIKTDPAHDAYIVGETSSTNFPVALSTNAPAYGGGTSDAYVAKIGMDVLRLEIALAGENVQVSWPAFTPEFVLEASDAIPANGWAQVSQPPQLMNRRHVVTMGRTNSDAFFRLRHW